MTKGGWRGRALLSALVSLVFAVGCGGGSTPASPAPSGTVGDGSDTVLKDVPQEPLLPLPPPEEPVVDDGCGCAGPSCNCDFLCGGGAAPAVEDIVVPPDTSETARLVRYWAIDRFALDGGSAVGIEPKYASSVLAKAKPDECFSGVIGDPIVKVDADGNCPAGTIKKTNDAYVWGLTLQNDNLFFGTLANTLCLVESGFLGVTAGHITSEWVCEFGASKSGMGDFRAPNMFRYDLGAGQLVSLNPPNFSKADIVRRGTLGFRSAGSLDGVAFIAGPGSSGGINFFAFDADTGAPLGDPQTIGTTVCTSDASPGQPRCPSNARYTNIRQWAAANGALYFGVGLETLVPDPDPASTVVHRREGGAVLRWTGTKEDPYHFVEIGRLPSDAANMIAHDDGRLYITTWPNAQAPAALIRSPIIPEGGLTEANVNDPEWNQPLWLATADEDYPGVPAYDPDRVTGMHYGGGALVSYAGRVLFGTMHVPFNATQDALEEYHLEDVLRTALGTHRSISVFVVDTPCDAPPTVRMLIGERFLPKYDAEAGGYTIRYDCDHRTGFTPLQGPSGFGNFFNSYTWSTAVYRGEAFIGTFDWSQLARVELETFIQGAQPDEVQASSLTPTAREFLESLGDAYPHEGGDLIRISCGGMCAESVDGLGNDRNYGFRNMVTNGDSLFVGTANPMNLDPKGGWELIEVK